MVVAPTPPRTPVTETMRPLRPVDGTVPRPSMAGRKVRATSSRFSGL